MNDTEELKNKALQEAEGGATHLNQCIEYNILFVCYFFNKKKM